MVMVFAGGHVSGAHYNPAVTLAVWLRGACTIHEAIGYWVFQLVAAAVAATVVLWFKGGGPLTQMTIDIPKVMETIGKGAAQSWQMDNRWKTMNEGKFDFGFAVDWMRKDLGIIMDEAKRNGASLPIAQIVDGYYETHNIH